MTEHPESTELERLAEEKRHPESWDRVCIYFNLAKRVLPCPYILSVKSNHGNWPTSLRKGLGWSSQLFPLGSKVSGHRFFWGLD